MVGHPQNHIIQVSSSSFEKTRTFSFLTLTVPFPSETSSSSGANECRFAPCRFGTAPWPLSLSHVHVHVQSAWLCLSDVSGSNTCISRNTHSLWPAEEPPLRSQGAEEEELELLRDDI